MTGCDGISQAVPAPASVILDRPILGYARQEPVHLPLDGTAALSASKPVHYRHEIGQVGRNPDNLQEDFGEQIRTNQRKNSQAEQRLQSHQPFVAGKHNGFRHEDRITVRHLTMEALRIAE
ncbi:hypothetical protein D3C75_632500 [compost metagenome]